MDFLSPQLAPRFLALAVASVLLVLPACVPGARKEEAFAGSIDVPEGTRRIEIRVPTGGATLLPGKPGAVTFDLLSLRQATDRSTLRQLEAIDLRPKALDTGAQGVLHIEVAGLPEGLRPEDPSDRFDPKRRNTIVVRGIYRVPADVEVFVSTGRGPISVADRTGASELRTGVGDILVERCSAPVTIRCGNGKVLIRDQTAIVDVETGIDSGHGDIFAFLDLESFTVDGDPPRCRFSTELGNISVTIPALLDFEAKLITRAGEIENGFGLKPQSVGKLGQGVRGRIGAGGLLVEANARKGNISIRPPH